MSGLTLENKTEMKNDEESVKKLIYRTKYLAFIHNLNIFKKVSRNKSIYFTVLKLIEDFKQKLTERAHCEEDKYNKQKILKDILDQIIDALKEYFLDNDEKANITKAYECLCDLLRDENNIYPYPLDEGFEIKVDIITRRMPEFRGIKYIYHVLQPKNESKIRKILSEITGKKPIKITQIYITRDVTPEDFKKLSEILNPKCVKDGKFKEFVRYLNEWF